MRYNMVPCKVLRSVSIVDFMFFIPRLEYSVAGIFISDLFDSILFVC